MPAKSPLAERNGLQTEWAAHLAPICGAVVYVIREKYIGQHNLEPQNGIYEHIPIDLPPKMRRPVTPPLLLAGRQRRASSEDGP